MTYARLFYHIVWATKNREPVLKPEMEEKIFLHIQKKAKSIGCKIWSINGYYDHIHLLIEIPPKNSVANVIKILKGASSFDFPDIYWQRGYGALTVSERNLKPAINYIDKQKDHHSLNSTIHRYEYSFEDKEKTIQEEQFPYGEVESLF